MLHFTKYAEKKFDVLNKHKIFFTREQIKEVVLNSDEINKKDKYYFAVRDKVCVVFQKQSGIKRIITFYPIK